MIQTEKINLNNIKPSQYNPRIITKETEEKLTKNMKEYGLVDPIIINLKNNTIIGGHQRYNVLKIKEENTGKTITLDLIRLGDIGWAFFNHELKIKDENHEKALNLALNKINGDWDNPKLNNILEELSNNHFDIELTGFDIELEGMEDIDIGLLSNFEEDDEVDDVIDMDIDYNTTTKKSKCPQCGYEWEE